MPNLGQSYRWTKAQKKAASIRMKAAYAKKKAGKGQKKFDFESATNMVSVAPPVDSSLMQAEDRQRSYEFHYRRGLVTAMECILRELR